MKLKDMVDQTITSDEEITQQLVQPDSLINLLTTLKEFDLKDLQMTTFADLRFIIESSSMLAARAQTLHDKRLKKTLQ